jgi:hypothetical protein
MFKKMSIAAILAFLFISGATIVAQTPFLDFDQTAGNWIVTVDDPSQNAFLLSDSSDAYQGNGSLKVSAKFSSFPVDGKAYAKAVFTFPALVNLSGADEIRFRIKIVSSSKANRSMQWNGALVDKPNGAAEAETWQWGPDYDVLYVSADTAWHQIVMPFSRLYAPKGSTPVNGVFDKESVSAFWFGIRADGTALDSISILIDDLRATKTVRQFQMVSFDDVDPGNGWQSNEANPWELTINTTEMFEGTGSLDVFMDIQEFEDWGAEAEVGWSFDTPYVDLTETDELRFRIQVYSPPEQVHSTRFYLWLMDHPEGEGEGEVWTTYPTYSVMTDEDKNGLWNEVVVPMDQFVFADWNDESGTVNNRVFDRDAITEVYLNVGADNPPGIPDIVEFLIDDLWATTGDGQNVRIADENPSGAPADFQLEPNFPNPFNPTTTIAFQVPQSCNLTLKVFDCKGRLVKTVLDRERTSTGIHTVKLDLSEQPSGIYFYSLEQNSSKLMQKMTLLK